MGDEEPLDEYLKHSFGWIAVASEPEETGASGGIRWMRCVCAAVHPSRLPRSDPGPCDTGRGMK